MAKGLTLAEAGKVMDYITASEAQRQEFEKSPKDVLNKLGIDGEAALNDCARFYQGRMSSLDALRASRDAMLGRLLTAHLSQNVHHVEM